MSWKVIVGLGMALSLSVSVVFAEESEKVNIALSSAEPWLNLVDEGRYADSWNEAAGYFKGAVKQERWEEMLQAVRKPLGKVISRKVQSKSFHTSLPGAPDG